jgi:glutamate decarboxylase
MIERPNIHRPQRSRSAAAHMLANLWNAPSAADSVGTSTIGSSEASMFGGMAGAAQGGRQAKPGVRPGAGLLAQVLPLLGGRETRNPDDPGHVSHGPRAHAGGGGREHHRGGADLRRDLHGPVRVRPADHRRARRAAGLDIDVHVDGASGAFLAPFVAPRSSGTSACHA